MGDVVTASVPSVRNRDLVSSDVARDGLRGIKPLRDWSSSPYEPEPIQQLGCL